MSPRRGFALLAALWVVAGLSAMALVGLMVAREVVDGAHNRIALMRDGWRAEDCAERARAAIADALGGASFDGWRILDRLVAGSPLVTSATCDVALVPTGMAVDINAASSEQVRSVLRVLKVPALRADSMVAALRGWREASRHEQLGNIRSLRRIHGFDATVLPDSVLRVVFTVEPGRILWSRAPLAVLASLPGVGDEALVRIAERRASGVPIANVIDLNESLSPSGRELLSARYADLQAMTTDRPDAWLLTARHGIAQVELRLAPANARAAITRRRTSP